MSAGWTIHRRPGPSKEGVRVRVSRRRLDELQTSKLDFCLSCYLVTKLVVVVVVVVLASSSSEAAADKQPDGGSCLSIYLVN